MLAQHWWWLVGGLRAGVLKWRAAAGRPLVLGFITAPAALFGAVLPPPEFGEAEDWHLPGGEKAVLVGSGSSLMAKLEVPALGDKERQAGGRWRGLLAIDLYGTTGTEAGPVRCELVEPATGTVIAAAEATASRKPPRAAWAVIASSEHPGTEAAKAFDGDSGSDWHSRYGEDGAAGPHWIGLAFGAEREITGLRVLPRQGGYTNGVPKKWRLEGRHSGAGWVTIAEGGTDKATVADQREAFEIPLSEPTRLEAFRLVILEDWSGGGFGTAAEIVPIGITLERPEETRSEPESRIWLEVPGELMEKLEGGELGLRVTSSKGDAVVGAHWCRIPEAPGRKFFGRSNGGLGPDQLGAGLLGFDAMTEHRQTVLSLMTVREGSPADQAGLRGGDAIVSISGAPLPENDLSPGWQWLASSHEALLGRASERALSEGRRQLELGVLRGGKLGEIAIPLRRQRAFSTMDPASDPEAGGLLADLLKWVRENQRDDGSWSGDIIRTTFAALALLATEEEEDEQRVKRAVEWSLKKYPEPDRYGNLGFWHGAYAGILYSEWHLRSGDRRVMEPLEALRDWAVAGQHRCIWDVPALGHGPSGLPYGNKALVAPACHLLVYEALAMRCGMKSEIWELLGPYMEMSWSDPGEGGHGGLGYNRSYKDTAEAWSRTGLFAMACQLRGERPDMRQAMTTFMKRHHPWLRNSHAYGEPGGALGLLALNLADPDSYREVIRDYAWWFSLAWEPGYGLRFTTPHMGAPYMGEDDLINPAYALVLQGPRRSLHLTGRPR